MLSLVVTFPAERTVFSTDFVDVFWNVNAANGVAAGEPSSVPINESPIRLFPGQDPGPEWGQYNWGQAPFGGNLAAPGIQFETPPCHFGRVKVTGKARDSVGNYQSGAVQITERVVNSTPEAPTRFKREAFAGGVQTFSFTQSEQLRSVA